MENIVFFSITQTNKRVVHVPYKIKQILKYQSIMQIHSKLKLGMRIKDWTMCLGFDLQLIYVRIRASHSLDSSLRHTV